MAGQTVNAEIEIRCTHYFTAYPKGYVTRGDETEPVWMVVKYTEKDTGKVFSATGTDLPAISDVEVILRGTWSVTERYGASLKVSSYEIVPPTTETGFVQYISSLRSGIGKTRGKAIYATFGAAAWDILENDPNRLTTVSGVSREAVDKLKDRLRNSKTQRELAQLCGGVIDIGGGRVNDIVKKFGPDAAEIVRDNPYALCSVSGFGFKAVDKLGRKLGVPSDSPARLNAIIGPLFDEAAMNGNTCVPREEFRKRMLMELNRGATGVKVTDAQVRQALNLSWQAGDVKIAGDMIFSKARYELEVSLAKDITRLVEGKNENIPGIDRCLAEYERECGVCLAASQREAVLNAFRHRITIVTGGPGTGKTTIIRAILYVHQKAYGKKSKPIFLSPTGRAARRMTEATQFPADTIHSAVSYKGEESFDPVEGMRDMIDANLFVVDETSMMDLYIASVLLSKVPDQARVVIVGDPDQLPSVGCGNVLHDMIRSESIPTTRLNVIFRQAEDSPIVTNAAKIRDGDVHLNLTRHFKLLLESSPQGVFERACRMYTACVKAYGQDNVILLNPYRDKSELNVNTFNLRLQSELNPAKYGELELVRDRNVHLRAGDKVMQMRNTDSARNGDIGYILRIEPVKDSDGTVQAVVEFNGDGKEHIYTSENVRELDLAYCTTIHKSQGSEYQNVLIVLSTQHEAMLRRNLLYTAVTRAKENVAIITEKPGTQLDRYGRVLPLTALEMAIRNDKTDIRYSLLSARLIAALKAA